MKKLAIKKVALSLFLAGYAASSAYALDPVITQNSIEGSKPVIWSKGITTGGTAVERSLTLRISNDTTGATSLGNSEKAKVGNYIHIFYDLVDADGDKDSVAKKAVANTLTVYAKIGTSTDWTEITDITKDFTVNDQEGHIFFQITPSMAGATKIGFKLEEITPYGAPRENEWLWVSDIWDGATKPGHGGSNPQDPGTDPHGPGDKDPDIPVGPIEYPGSTMLGIFKYTSTGSVDFTDNLAASGSAVTPKYGDKLAAVVWLKANSSSTSTTPNFTTGTGGDTNQSASYTFTWSLDGTNSAAGGSQTAVAGDTLTAAPRDAEGYGVIQLGDTAGGKHNAVYSSLNGGAGYDAGIQGFKLKVTAN